MNFSKLSKVMQQFMFYIVGFLTYEILLLFMVGLAASITQPQWFTGVFGHSFATVTIWGEIWHTLGLVIVSVIFGGCLLFFKKPLIKSVLIALAVALFSIKNITLDSEFLALHVFDTVKILLILPITAYFLTKKFDDKLKNKFTFNF